MSAMGQVSTGVPAIISCYYRGIVGGGLPIQVGEAPAIRQYLLLFSTNINDAHRCAAGLGVGGW